MRTNAGCAVALLTVVHCLSVNATNSKHYEFDFHVSNLQRNGVRRTVVNGQSLPSCSFHMTNSLMYASQINTQVK